MNRNYIIVAVIIVLVFLIGGFLYWQNQKREVSQPIVEEKPESLGAQIFEKTENPVKGELPETNPFSADTNPFDAPTNPFKSEYKNPFK